MDVMADSPRDSPRWRDVQRERLADLNALGFASDVPQALAIERREVAATVDSFSYPVITVPYELVAHIFLHCLPADGRVRPSPRAAPLLLAQICSDWRQIALETKQLWSSFDFTFRGTIDSAISISGEPSYDGACALLETWVNRSNGDPLSITLRLARTREAIPTRILGVVFQFSQQWGRLEATLANHQDVGLFRRRLSGPFPLLYSLSLNITAVAGSLLRRTDTLAPYRDSPRLQHLKLFRWFRFSDIPSGHFPLKTLELHKWVSIEDCSAIFRRFPSLIHLTLSVVEPLPSPVPAMELVSSLESLTLDSGGDLLVLLTLPHLRRLQYTISAPESLTTLLFFLARSTCVLQQLELRVKPVMDDYALIECLQAIPSVEDLRIDYDSRGPRTLYQHLRAPAVLPRLRALTISENLNAYNYTPVVEMLRARRQRDDSAFVNLLSFDLHLTSESSADDHRIPGGISTEEIARLIQGGLRFCVHGPDIDWPGGEWQDDLLEFPLCREA